MVEPPGLASRPETSAYAVGCFLVQDPGYLSSDFPWLFDRGKEGPEAEGVTWGGLVQRDEGTWLAKGGKLVVPWFGKESQYESVRECM